MEELRARHRKEQRDLQAQVTQKKKAASKKTRKGVNEECTKLEKELKDQQEQELAAMDGIESTINADEQTTNGHAQEEDDDLLAALAGDTTLDEPKQDTDGINGTREDKHTATKKPNRQKARLARRAAEQEAAVAQAKEEAANMPDQKQRERSRMLEEFKKRGLQEKEVAANGHCMYSAMADQMRQLGVVLAPGAESSGALKNDDYKTVRARAAAFISENPDDFLPFLEEPLDDYVRKIRDTGEWGGQLELMALAKAYNLNIHVLQGDGRVENIESGQCTPNGDAWVGYYKHGFGLGEHYNSLRKAASTGDNG